MDMTKANKKPEWLVWFIVNECLKWILRVCIFLRKSSVNCVASFFQYVKLNFWVLWLNRISLFFECYDRISYIARFVTQSFFHILLFVSLVKSTIKLIKLRTAMRVLDMIDDRASCPQFLTWSLNWMVSRGSSKNNNIINWYTLKIKIKIYNLKT